MPTSLNPYLWSVTAGDNDDADPGINWAEGQTPGSVNASARAMMAGFARLLADINGTKSAAGGANDYTIASGNIDHTALTNGIILCFRASFTNTSQARLNLNSLGLKPINVFSTAGEVVLAPGQIQSGGHYIVQYNTSAAAGGGAWILLNPAFDTAHPPGAIMAYAGTTAPSGWLICNGAAVSQTTYAALFAIIGTTYNTGGEGVGNFRLPDLTGRAIFGKEASATRITSAGSGINGATLGAVGGLETHTLTTAQLAQHLHAVGTLTADGNTASGSVTALSGTINGNGANLSVPTASDTHVHNWSSPSARTFTAGTGTSNRSDVWVGSTLESTTTTTGGAFTGAINSNTISASLSWAFSSGTISVNSHTHTVSGSTANAGSGNAHNNMPPAIILNFIIKT